MDKNIIIRLDEYILEIENGRKTIEECAADVVDDHELLALLQAYKAARDGSVLQPSVEFKSDSRSRMLNRIKLQESSVTNPDAARPIRQKQQKNVQRRMRMSWIISAVTALTLLLGGTTAAAASDALPGDVLYELKTGFQEMRLNFAEDESDVDLLLGFMNGNLEEINQLMQQGRLEDLEKGLNQYNKHLAELNETQNRISYDSSHPDDALVQRIQDQLKTQTQTMQQLCDQTLDGPIKLQLQEAIRNAEESPGLGPNENGQPGDPGEPSGAGPGEQQGETHQNQEGKQDQPGQPIGTPQGTPQGTQQGPQAGTPQGTQQGPGGSNEEPGSQNGPGDSGSGQGGGNK